MSEWIERLSPGFVSEVWRGLDPRVQGRLSLFGDDVVRFGRSQNLVSRQDPMGEVARLIEESVRAGALLCLSEGHRLLDVGSGAGFPGLVFATLVPDVEVVLVERRSARCDFLERSVRRLELDRVLVVNGDVRRVDEGSFDVVSGKAVVDPREFVAWVGPHLRSAGRIVLFQRQGWSPPPPWTVVDSCRALEDLEKGDRWAFAIRGSD